MYHERVRRGELPASKDITFVMISGDGGMDIGMGPALGAANRNHRMMILEYDNQGYMNTGAQLSYSTPFGHRTSTSEVGKSLPGKRYHHKDTAQIFAACHLPYVFTASEGYPEDLMRKVAKAQWYAKHEGLVYGKILSFCPLNWRTADDAAQPVLQAAIDSCFFPLYEIEHGHTTLTYDPDATGPPPSRVGLAEAHGQDPPSAGAGERGNRARASRPRPTAAGRASRPCTSTRFSRTPTWHASSRPAGSPRSPSTSGSTRRSSRRRRSRDSSSCSACVRAASAFRSRSPTTIAMRAPS